MNHSMKCIAPNNGLERLPLFFQNFNFESLKESIGPLCMRLGKSTGLAALKVKADKASNILKQAEGLWKTMVPEIPFQYRFMDESFDEMYRAEQRIGKIAFIFSKLQF